MISFLAAPSRVAIVFGTMMTAVTLSTVIAAPGDSNIIVVRDLSGRVGPIIGSALACDNIARPRVRDIADKFQAVIQHASPVDAERDSLTRILDRYVADGRNAVASGKLGCAAAERQLSELEQSLAGQRPQSAASPSPSLDDASRPGTAPAPAAPSAATAAASSPPASPGAVHGITDREIRFGMVMPFSGSIKETARLYKLGIDAAFNVANDAGGTNGRMLRLIGADDGYEPTRTVDAMKQLSEREQVFGYVGNIGTATAASAIPYALERRMLFFAAYTGSNLVRRNPPDRYVFNYRPSYAEETDALVRYLVKRRKLQPRQIVVFAQDDSYGDAGFAGVVNAFRALGVNANAVQRLNYPRNTVEVDDAVNRLRAQRVPFKAVIMVAATRAAAKFIEKTHDLFPDMIYGNISAVSGSALAHELLLLGPRYTNGVIVTQAAPAVAGYSTLVLEYKSALARYFPGELPDYTSLEGYIAASVLVRALKQTGPQLDTEKLIDNLESIRDLDLGIGALLNFGRAEHQASHKIWGTALDETGTYQAIELD